MSTQQKAFWMAQTKSGNQNSGPKDTREEAVAWAQNHLSNKVDCASVFVGYFNQAVTRKEQPIELVDLEPYKQPRDMNVVEKHNQAFGKLGVFEVTGDKKTA